MGCQNSKSGKGGHRQGASSNSGIDIIAFNNFIQENKNDPREDYKFGRILGEGSYGQVCKVIHKKTNEPRAMKKIPKKSLSTDEQKMRLVNDIEILKYLSHPSILKVYEFYQDEDSFFVSTEFCQYGELFSRIEQVSELSEKEASNVIKQCLEVLVYIHKQKVAHRDLKPENIMIDRIDQDSKTYDIKIIDWGCAKKYDKNPIMTERLGTPYFIAPEVINDKGPIKYDYKCDLWSLGVILYALLCGEPCFTGDSAEEVMAKVRTGQYTFHQPVWNKISEDAKNLIGRLLTFDPAKRITAEEALQHKWIQNAPHNKIDAELMKQTKENMKNFRCKNELGYAIMSYISSQLIAKDDKVAVTKAFKALDKNGDGTLTKDEIYEFYKQTLNEEAAMEEVESLMKKADQNNNNQINYEEFVVAVVDSRVIQNENKLRQAFNYFDQDRNGYITADELQNVLGNPGMDKTQVEYWKKLIVDTDKDGDKKISFQEFKQLILTSIQEEFAQQ